MRSNHARLIQNILNHIKWQFQFPSFLSVLRVLDWLIVGFIFIGRQLPTCSMQCILSSLLTSKEVSYLPMFSSLHSTVRIQDPEWHVGFVGTIENGYVRNVPLPRIPQIQSTNQIASVLICRNHTNTWHSRIPWIPTYSELRCSPEGFGTIPVVPFFPLVG